VNAAAALRGVAAADSLFFAISLAKDRPEPEEVIPKKALDESIGKAAFAYTNRWLGPREEIGSKGAGLGNRLRAALKAK